MRVYVCERFLYLSGWMCVCFRLGVYKCVYNICVIVRVSVSMQIDRRLTLCYIATGLTF